MPKAPFKETGRRLREARTGKELSQSELAAESRFYDPEKKGITPSAIGNYEQGIRRPSRKNAALLEKVFDIPASYFLGEITKQEATFLKALRSEK